MVILFDGLLDNRAPSALVHGKHPLGITNGHLVLAPPNQRELAGRKPDEFRNGHDAAADNDSR